MVFPKGFLNDLEIASPCHAAWADMNGSQRVRFCSDCRQHVYNLSNLTRRQAEDLILATEGRLCVRFYQRADGGVMTQDCSLREQVPPPRHWKRAGVLAAFAFFIVGAIALAVFSDRSSRRLTELPVIGPVFRWMGFQEPCIMGMAPPVLPIPAPPPNPAPLEPEPVGPIQ